MRSVSLGLALLLSTSTISIAQENNYVLPSPEKAAASSRILSRSELEIYLQGKKVALFGEAHSVRQNGEEFNYLVDDMHFRALIPTLKRLGYTHIALEVEYKYEKRVQKGIQSIQEAREGIGMTAATIGPVALQYGLEVICIDNRDEDRIVLRDEYMEQRISAVVKQGGRVAYYVGSGHLQMVNHNPEIATVELNSALAGGGKEVLKKVNTNGAKPLAQRLVERYGPQSIAVVSMDNCSDGLIPYCFLE